MMHNSNERRPPAELHHLPEWIQREIEDLERRQRQRRLIVRGWCVLLATILVLALLDMTHGPLLP